MVTLKEIAKLANVDSSTVSRALNDTAYVHPETKQRVIEAATQLSYKPNLIKKAMLQGKRKTIGVVVPGVQLSIFGDLVEVIEKEATKHQYEILIGITKDNPSSEKECLNRLRNGFVDGLVIASTGKNNRLIREIQTSNNIPVIQIIREHDNHISSIVGNYYESAYFAVDFLISKGCKHIGFINGTRKQAPYKERHLGYIDAMKKNGLLVNVNYIFKTSNDDFKDGYIHVDKLLEKDPSLEAILVANDSQGVGVLRRLKEKNILVPNQIKVMSLTGNLIGGLLETGLTAMELSAEKVGKKATNVIIELIEKQHEKFSNPQKIVFDSYLVERESTK